MSKKLLWLLMVFPAGVLAQERQVFKGKAITDIGTVEDVSVTNAATGISVVTRNEGDFSLKAKKGDTLHFSGGVYKPLIIVLKEKDLNEHVFVVRLDPLATMLDEVVVSGLTGNLAADSKNLKTMQVNTWFDPIEINKDVVPQTSIGANWVTGFSQLLKKKKQPKRATTYAPSVYYVEKTLFSEVVRGAYADAFFTETLNIPAKFIPAFLGLCDEDAKQYLLIKQNEDKLLDYLKNKALEFLKLNPDARQ